MRSRRALALALVAMLSPACRLETVTRVEQTRFPVPVGTSGSASRSPTPSARPSAAPRFRASSTTAPAERMRSSWRAGCPVPISRLRLLTLTHYGFDGKVHTGELVVHQDAVTDLTTVFRRLFNARFPVQRMRLVDVYGASDDRSMAANNTSAFNCRKATGSRTKWSQHSFGRAIDINPVQNPWVTSGGEVKPPAARAYLDRDDMQMGMIVRGDEVVSAFRAVGWGWGGNFRTVKDYQHFSATGG